MEQESSLYQKLKFFLSEFFIIHKLSAIFDGKSNQRSLVKKHIIKYLYWINHIKIGSSKAKFFCFDRTSTKKHYLAETNVVVDAIMMISFDFGKNSSKLAQGLDSNYEIIKF